MMVMMIMMTTTTMVMISVPSGCTGYFTGPSGHLTSPGYPGGYIYTEETECMWKIERPSYYQLHLSFDDVHTNGTASSLEVNAGFLSPFIHLLRIQRHRQPKNLNTHTHPDILPHTKTINNHLTVLNMPYQTNKQTKITLITIATNKQTSLWLHVSQPETEREKKKENKKRGSWMRLSKINIHILIHIHTYLHTYIHTCTHIYTHTSYIYTHTYTYPPTYAYTHI